MGKHPSNQVSELFGAKTLSRINDYCQSENISLNEHWKYNDFQPVSIQDLLDTCSAYLPKDCGLSSVLELWSFLVYGGIEEVASPAD